MHLKQSVLDICVLLILMHVLQANNEELRDEKDYPVGEVKAQLAVVQNTRSEAEKLKKQLSASQVCSLPLVICLAT